MIDHRIYEAQLEPAELPAGLEEEVAPEVSADSVAIEAGPNGGAELVSESKFGRLEKQRVQELIQTQTAVELVVLNLRVAFPRVRYEICAQR